MIDGRRVARNFLSLSLAQAVGFLCGLGTTILLARNLGPGNFGILGFGQAFVGFAGILVVMGTDAYGAREIAREPSRARPLIAEILGLRIVLAGVAIPALFVIAFAVGDAGPQTFVIAIQALGLIGTVITVDFALQGVQRMGAIALRQAAAALLVFAGAAALIRDPQDLYVAAALPVVAVALTAAWLMRRVHARVAPLGVRFAPARWRRWIGPAATIAVGGLSIAVFQYTDVLMLGFAVPDSDVGRYVAFGRLYTVVVTVGNLLGAAFAPALAQLGRAGAPQRQTAYRLFLVAALTLGGPAAAALATFPHAAVALFYGAAYAADPGVLSIIMLSAIVFLGTVVTSATLVAWDDQLFHTKALGAAALLNVVLNAALIPAFALWGAAAATLASVACLLAAEVARLSRRHGIVEVAPFAGTAVLLAGVFGLAYVIRQWAAPSWLDGAPALTIVLFGGGAALAFLALAAATGLIEPRRMLRLARGG